MKIFLIAFLASSFIGLIRAIQILSSEYRYCLFHKDERWTVIAIVGFVLIWAVSLGCVFAI